jgi:hypothetical protein
VETIGRCLPPESGKVCTLFCTPLFPAAQRCALEVVLSMLCALVDFGFASVFNIVCQMRSLDHRLNRM